MGVDFDFGIDSKVLVRNREFYFLIILGIGYFILGNYIFCYYL